jgi:hypothetical protein
MNQAGSAPAQTIESSLDVVTPLVLWARVYFGALHETFATPGRYTLTFSLTRLGQKLIARLGAAQRAYRKRHPHGHRPPQIVVSVARGYTPIG